ncbi:DUF2631 domain-containing protein [Pseudonocardia nematodicida]|uniref:DUF2631 domain-containing protein n=1 Tax=Pseudonocardia nematodicida TaxID=1206997 RepID=A0ABV1KK97_9PSEU
MASNSREVAVRSGVDPAEEPSVDWGWHARFPKGMKIAAGLVGISLLLMLIGHPVSWTEFSYMAVPAVACFAGVVFLLMRSRHSWRR